MANPVGTLFVNFVKMREKSPLLTIGVQCGHGLQHSERPGWDVASHIFAGLGFALLARRSSASIGRWTYFFFKFILRAKFKNRIRGLNTCRVGRSRAANLRTVHLIS